MTQPARTTWLLLGSVLLVSGAIWFLDLFAPIRTTGRPPEGRIVPFPEPEITGLSVQTGTLSVELQRDADTWILVSPVQAPADTFRVGQIFDQLLVMMRGETISRREQKELGLTPADYGLDTPRASITIHTGDTAETIRFGRAAPVGADLYVMIDGKPEILSTQTRILDLLPATRDWIAANRADRNLGEIAEDLEEQLAWLFRPRFAWHAGFQRLRDYPRRLTAIRSRLGRVSSLPIVKDLEKMERLRVLWVPWFRKWTADPGNPQLWETGWMLEEYRVSLFAPDVPTQAKVSEKRIAALLGSL